MSDQRRGRRPDTRRDWDAPEQQDEYGSRGGGGGQGGGSRHNNSHYRSRSRERHDGGGGRYDDRSRSPDRRSHYRDGGDRDGGRGRGRGRGGGRGGDRRDRDYNNSSRRYDDRRDRRDYDNDGGDRRGGRDRRRRSQSPRNRRDHDNDDDTRMDEDGKPPHKTSAAQKNTPGAAAVAVPLPTGNDEDDMAAMQAMMGFGGFGTTKDKRVAGNNAGAVRKEKKTEYRQYMNREGGFNRELSPTRE